MARAQSSQPLVSANRHFRGEQGSENTLYIICTAARLALSERVEPPLNCCENSSPAGEARGGWESASLRPSDLLKGLKNRCTNGGKQGMVVGRRAEKLELMIIAEYVGEF